MITAIQELREALIKERDKILKTERKNPRTKEFVDGLVNIIINGIVEEIDNKYLKLEDIQLNTKYEEGYRDSTQYFEDEAEHFGQ